MADETTGQGRVARQKVQMGLGYRGYLLLMALSLFLGGAAYLTIPDRLTTVLVSSLTRERAEEWIDEFQELELVDRPGYEVGAVSPIDAQLISYMARAGEIFRISLFNKDREPAWSSFRHLEAVTISPDLETVLRRERDKVARMLVSVYPADASQIDDIEDGETKTNLDPNGHYFLAEVISTEIRSGAIIGYLQIKYNITRLYQWYATSISSAIMVLTIGVTLLIAIAAVINQVVRSQIARSLSASAAYERHLSDKAAKQSRDIQAIRELSEWLQSSKSLDEFFDLLKRFMQQILPEHQGAIYIFDKERRRLSCAASWRFPADTALPPIEAHGCWSMRRGRPYHYGVRELNFACGHVTAAEPSAYTCLPIVANGEALGFLHLVPPAGDRGHEVCQRENDLATTCVDQISMSFANVILRDRLQEQNIRDPLTNLYNRRGYRQHLEATETTEGLLHIVILDLDHFKQFNDKFGHDAGDVVLVAVASELASRNGGVAYRLGGEEMGLILQGPTRAEAAKQLELIRCRISSLALSFGGQRLPQVTASFGAASWPSDCADPTELLALADLALYRAKDSGRNRVVWYDGGAGVSETGGPDGFDEGTGCTR